MRGGQAAGDDGAVARAGDGREIGIRRFPEPRAFGHQPVQAGGPRRAELLDVIRAHLVYDEDDDELGRTAGGRFGGRGGLSGGLPGARLPDLAADRLRQRWTREQEEGREEDDQTEATRITHPPMICNEPTESKDPSTPLTPSNPLTPSTPLTADSDPRLH